MKEIPRWKRWLARWLREECGMATQAMLQRPKFTFVSPNKERGHKQVEMFCEHCGTVVVFSDESRCRAPRSGYWRPCLSCDQYRHFYLIEDGRTVNNSAYQENSENLV